VASPDMPSISRSAGAAAGIPNARRTELTF
jgi:hypothetical protein